MKNQVDVKEKIIEATMALIKESEGFVENITIRKIAKKANVPVGLLNYHFVSKDNLIEICVQKIIADIINVFPNIKDKEDSKALKENKDINLFTKNVFKFLIKNPEISKISMLGDLSHPNPKNNSSISYRAILRAVPEKDKNKKITAFIFLATIQSAFLNRSVSKELIGLDLNKEEDYNVFFDLVTNTLNLE